ncbi:hydrolase [Clostridium chromiireducens]|uniref:Hydrolase n=1 Tax=Clostridium chromiireducens TaxID=225345 RepID=A0A964W346_9CLOT|nr:hydrolase [Clostridium chromiireducens]MVX64929.1 hydrolase [Clostridium chromiireducens]
MDNLELTIQNGNKLYYPSVLEGVIWELDRVSVPGKLTFDVMADNILNIEEGNVVRMRFGNINVFYGYVFTIKMNKDGTLKITAYDQLRYLKDKHSLIYYNQTATEVIQMIAEQFNLKLGTVDDTGFKIDRRVEDNKELFDIIQIALDKSMVNTGKLHVLYDDFGKLTLKNIENMWLPLLYDNDAAEDFEYITSIDTQTYNRIKVAYDNKETGKREIYMTEDSENISKWGVLQYYHKVDKPENAANMAKVLLELFNKKSKSLSLSNALGDIRVRAGSSFYIKLDIAETPVRKLMVVDKVKHKFNNGEHFMDLSLRGDIAIKYFTDTNGTVIVG